MSLTTIWTHGNAVQVEDPGDYQYIRHRGRGTELMFNPIDPNSDTIARWCHIPISTPTSVDGEAATLSKIILLYEADNQIALSKIDIFDGWYLQQSLRGSDKVPDGDQWFSNSSGAHLDPDPYNQFTLREPFTPSYGIGITLWVYVGAGAGLTVAAVGADFVYPNPSIDRALTATSVDTTRFERDHVGRKP